MGYWDNVITDKEFDSTDLRNSQKSCILCNSNKTELKCIKCNGCYDHCFCKKRSNIASIFKKIKN